MGKIGYHRCRRSGGRLAQGHGKKLAMARAVKAAGYPMVLNVVLHRHNIDRLDNIIALCDELGADAVVLANCQMYGWAHLNREGLLPSREQLETAEATTARCRERLAERGRDMGLLFVVPDYYNDRPKACMGGCRCQAFLLTGDPAATDPVCNLSPDHHLIEAARREAERDTRVVQDLTPRNVHESRVFCRT